MIRDLLPKDRSLFLSMVKRFYASDAVMHEVDFRNFEITFDAVMSGSPFLRALMIEDGEIPVGYALLSFTYSNEVGGMVVLIEELYISEAHRDRGFGRAFFEFLEKAYPLAKRFRLEVRRDNKKAVDLYNRLGYGVLDYMQMIKAI